MARRPTPIKPAGSAPTDSSGLVGHAVALARHTIPPIHPAGRPFVVGALAVVAVGGRTRWVRGPALSAAAACALFFRHPPRTPPTATGVAVAPADGETTLVDSAVPPSELGLGADPLPRVSIFLSIFDAHVQRAPVAGTVSTITHTPGAFLSADLPAASIDNERVAMTLHTAPTASAPSHSIGVVQIAGLVARRIVNQAHVGQTLDRGETYGLIRFGSRVDTYLPAGSELLIEPGQRAVGGETILARLP